MDNKLEEIKKLLESAQTTMMWHGYTTIWWGNNDEIAQKICDLFPLLKLPNIITKGEANDN